MLVEEILYLQNIKDAEKEDWSAEKARQNESPTERNRSEGGEEGSSQHSWKVPLYHVLQSLREKRRDVRERNCCTACTSHWQVAYGNITLTISNRWSPLNPTQALQLHNGVRQVRKETEEPSLLLLLRECECGSAHFTWKVLRSRDCQCAPSVGNKSAWLRATAWSNIQVTLKMWVKPNECCLDVHSSGLQVPMPLEWPWWEPFVIFVRLGSVTGAHHANFRIYLSWIQPKVPVSTCVLLRTAWSRLHRMRKRCLGPWWQDLHL